MRVTLVCPYDWSAYGGVRGHVAALADALGDRHEVTVLAPASAAVDDPRVAVLGRPVGVPFNGSVAPVALSPLAAVRTRAAVAGSRPDVVHVHEPLAPLVGTATSATATSATGAPVVGTFHAWAPTRRTLRAVAPVARRLVRRLAARIAVSNAAADHAAEGLGLRGSSFEVIPNGVDVARFATAQPLPDLADPDRPLVLFVGRFEPRKGPDVAIRAYLRLRAEVPAARLCLVGDGPERAACERMVPPGVRPDVIFTGRVHDTLLPRYHASADVFVSPATSGESFGMVLLEAMATGTPVVASDLPGHRAVVTDGRQGRLVPVGDATALAERLVTLLGAPRLRAAQALEGRRTAAQHDWSIVAERVERVYERVAASTP